MAEDCGNHEEDKRRHLYHRLFVGFLVLVIAVLLTVLIIWLALRPTKPAFRLEDASLLELNLTLTPSSNSPILSAVFQITLSSRNPNDRVGVYYDRLDAFLLYDAQRVSAATSLPAGYQGHGDVTVWSTYLSGGGTLLAPYMADSLAQDERAGFILFHLRVDGRLRWKVGSWMSSRYPLRVSCPALFAVDGDSGFRFQRSPECSVDI
ncbi:NDR1/HIN1-like protein 1 [Curcuma longa]|uniref:NDR1/HIN1-like protein 1 n=1 Tax=Curcuma longa TaxID=136217 RepID=UPI003D9F1679